MLTLNRRRQAGSDDAASTTPGSEEAFEGSIGGNFADLGLDADLISSDKIVICYQDDADADKGKCIIGDTPSVGAARRIWHTTP